MQRFLVFSNNTFIFYTHLGYSLNFTVSFHCQVMGPIPPPSGGIVGKNWSTRSKIPVRSKRVGLPRVKWGPFTWIPQCYLLIRIYVLFTSLPQMKRDISMYSSALLWADMYRDEISLDGEHPKAGQNSNPSTKLIK